MHEQQGPLHTYASCIGTIMADPLSLLYETFDKNTELAEAGIKALALILTQIIGLILSRGTEHLKYQRSPSKHSIASLSARDMKENTVVS